MDRRPLLIAVAAVALILFFVIRPAPPPGPPDAPSGDSPLPLHLTLGNPSRAAADPAAADNYLLLKPEYALSYNAARGGPNWVSWCLRKGDLGDAPRAPFYPDPDLPAGVHRVTPAEYAGSGFDRGHMCPHSDRAATAEASRATFAMSNMVPQAPNLNQKAWADLEDYLRGLVRHTPAALYVVCGPAGRGGVGADGPAETIAHGRVVVPAECWKVVLVVEGGTGGADDVRKVGPDTRAIAVVMPNDEAVGHGWAKYRTSVAAVEELTGYRFFDRVPAAVLEPLKRRVDDVHVPAPHHPSGKD